MAEQAEIIAGSQSSNNTQSSIPWPQRIAASSHGMIATANQWATEAGAEILAKGGNAVDAAVCAAFALGVCEPFRQRSWRTDNDADPSWLNRQEDCPGRVLTRAESGDAWGCGQRRATARAQSHHGSEHTRGSRIRAKNVRLDEARRATGAIDQAVP